MTSTQAPLTDLRHNDTEQSEIWLKFYEIAWAARGEYAQSLIADGETKPIRIIELMRARDRKTALTLNPNTGVWEFSPVKARGGIDISPAGTPIFAITSFRGERIVVPYYAAHLPIKEFMIDYIDNTGPYDCIVELGCGYGSNLFEIYYGGGPRSIPYFGGEITTSGRATASRIAALDPDFHVTFVPFDHTRPDLSFLPKVERLLVFTVHSLEQVKHVGRGFFAAVAAAAPQVRCLNFEPFGFQTNDTGALAKKQCEFFERNGWNLDFAPQLMAARIEGLLSVDYAANGIFLNNDPINPTSLAIWSAPVK